VCVTPSENVAVVAVRGSVNIRNILSALQVWPTPTEKGIGVSLHSGFAQVADEMMVKIEPLLHKGMKIHLTGHSLGGAVSTILALRLKAKGYDISQVVAFGMPLVVWAGDQRELPLDIPLLRVEHPLDPVVHFPGEITGVRASFLSYDSCASAVLRNRHTARCRR
jgi:pimeloyl-ACP methyl ester carboxylesterase